MGDIKRYVYSTDKKMKGHYLGNWVRYSDVARLVDSKKPSTNNARAKPCANCVSNSNSQTGFDRCQYCIHSELHHDNFEPRTASPVA